MSETITGPEFILFARYLSAQHQFPEEMVKYIISSSLYTLRLIPKYIDISDFLSYSEQGRPEKAQFSYESWITYEQVDNHKTETYFYLDPKLITRRKVKIDSTNSIELNFIFYRHFTIFREQLPEGNGSMTIISDLDQERKELFDTGPKYDIKSDILIAKDSGDEIKYKKYPIMDRLFLKIGRKGSTIDHRFTCNSSQHDRSECKHLKRSSIDEFGNKFELYCCKYESKD